MFSEGRNARFLCLLVLLLVASCQTSKNYNAHESCPSDGVDFSTLFDQKYVTPFREGRAQDWVKVFADDAVALHNRRAADVGKDKILSFGEMVVATFRLGQYDIEIVDTRVGCNWAISHGVYNTAFIFRESGESAPWGPESGKLLVAWEYMDGHGWKIIFDMGNTLD